VHRVFIIFVIDFVSLKERSSRLVNTAWCAAFKFHDPLLRCQDGKAAPAKFKKVCNAHRSFYEFRSPSFALKVWAETAVSAIQKVHTVMTPR